MGRRKWKQYQDVMLRSPLTVEVEDWEPQDKCCFCDGRALLGPAPVSPSSDSGSSTNSRSSFRETPPVTLSEGHSAAAHHNPSPSVTAMTTLESVTSMAASLAAVAALSVNSNHSANTNSSSGALPPGAGAMPFYPPSHHHSGLFPPWYLSPSPPHLTPGGRNVLPSALADGLRLESVPSAKQDTPVPPIVMSLPASASTEQPLDLSAKASSCPPSGESSSGLCSRIPTPDQSLKVPSLDPKHIFKAKPRMSTVAGRRTYTEEELQAALRDIQSGKLGTRRAAVIYGIPRSTLRNKVYKLAMERDRDSHLGLSAGTPLAVVQGDKGLLSPVTGIKVEVEDEKELSGAEDEREVEKALRKPLLSMEDLVRFSMLEGSGLATAESLRTLLQHGKFQEERQRGQSGLDSEDGTSPPVFPGLPHPDLWRNVEHSALGPFISQLLAAGQREFASGVGSKNPSGGVSVTPGENSPTDVASDFLPKFPSPLLPELVRRMMAEEEQLRIERSGAHQPDGSSLLNGAAPDENFKSEGKLVRPAGLQSSVITRPDTSKVKTEEPMDAEAAATSSGMATPPNVILKIPSFKPTSKNGVASGGGINTSGSTGSQDSPFSTLGSFSQLSSNRSPSAGPESSQQSAISNLAGAGARSNHSDSCSPPVASLVGKGIGVSLRDVIAKSISQKFQQGSDMSHLPLSQKLLLQPDSTDQSLYKRGQFNSSLSSSVVKHNNNNNHLDDRNAQKTSATSKQGTGSSNSGNSSSGGKGTRPKRGKYRNYDRDSLVEAVRAVQRGEMSVHRAGSYYGVPHSTLEYKVKERHLMRPRKREPKTQAEDAKRKEESNVLRTQPAEKLKMPSKPPKVPFTPNSPMPNAPNGLKIPPLFDPSIPSLAYATPPPFPFWPPNPFHHSLPMPDFSRGSSGGAASSFSPSTEQFFASQMMQRLQEESSRIHSNTSPGISAVRSPCSTLGKTAREMAESLYDGTGANGSFLDGIIRSSLEMGLPSGGVKESSNGSNSEKVTAPENMSNKALLDQLCRNSCLTPLPRATLTAHDNGGCDDDSRKQSSLTTPVEAESETSISAVDLSPLSNGSTEHDKAAAHTEGEEEVKSPRVNTKDTSAKDGSFLKETNGLSNANDDPTDNVSACDSKTNLTRVGDIDAAKDLTQEEGSEDPATQEDTKSRKINS
ncbi:mushroom body large-type Kenyon cell-specific protein 1 [Anabrus simplex]|uniref:mushroom body large-type Kenyon cell-specific protein 1 n=1 Tax=Anabrus simplex TaxID=316456 RepID=UPI0035A38754